MKTLLRFIALILALIVAMAGGYAVYGLWVPGHSARWPPPPLSSEETLLSARLKADIAAIASEPHNVQRPAALARSAAAVEAAFRDIGYAPQSQVFDTAGVQVRNIFVTIEPSSNVKSTLVIGGHYDAALDAPGANDNASGTAAAIELSRVLKDYRPRDTRLIFVAFVNEEAPYWGSPEHGARRFAEMLRARGEPVRGMLSLETIGWFSDAPGSQKYPAPFSWIYPDTGNFVAFVGMPGSREFLHDVLEKFRHVASVPTIGGIAPSFIPGIAWSDHKAFADLGFPALMVTDTAPFRYPHYHRPSDTPDKVDTDMLARITISLAQTLRAMAPP